MLSAYITHPDCTRHEMGPHHPECPERLGAINDMLLTKGLLDYMAPYDAEPATVDQLERAHAALYVQELIAAGAVRMTKANQFGLLGFGGQGQDARRLQLEGSLGIMLRDDLVLGAEYRMKPDNLAYNEATAFLEEDHAWDVFVAWFPHRLGSLTLAWVNLGNIAGKKDQAGVYVSGQLSF